MSAAHLGRGFVMRQILHLDANKRRSAAEDLERAKALERPLLARAEFGRLMVYQGRVPQRGLASPEAVAWERESGREPGYYNRRARRFLQEVAERAQEAS